MPPPKVTSNEEPEVTPQKEVLKSADADPNVASKKDSVPPAGAQSKDEQPPPKLSDSQDDGPADKKEGEEGGGQSESLVRGSYLPANKLQDAPPASQYEGKNPEDYMKTKGPGFGEQVGEKLHELKEKITPNKDK